MSKKLYPNGVLIFQFFKDGWMVTVEFHPKGCLEAGDHHASIGSILT